MIYEEPTIGKLYRLTKILTFSNPNRSEPGEIFMYLGKLPDKRKRIRPCLLDPKGNLCFYHPESAVANWFGMFFQRLD